MNKKKIILISSIALIIIIAIICTVVSCKDKNTSKDNNETTSKVTEVTSTDIETEAETNTETQSESSSEVESITEETTTAETETQSSSEMESTIEEITTTKTEPPSSSEVESTTEKTTTAEKATVDPFTFSSSGKYTQEQQLVDDIFTFYLRTYENGVKEYVVHAYLEYYENNDVMIDKYYRVADVGEVPQIIRDDVANTLMKYYDNQNQEQQTTEKEEEYVKPEISELEWLKEKYGNKIIFEYRGDYIFNEVTNSYICVKLDGIYHVMTSETTSEEIEVYTVEEIDTVNFAHCYGYLTGHWESSLASNIIKSWEGFYSKDLTELDTLGSYNMELLKPIIQKEIDNGYLTIHGLPISIDSKLYIYMEMYNSDGSKVEDSSFTIEEYYNFVNNKKWTIGERTYIKDYVNISKEVTELYVILE